MRFCATSTNKQIVAQSLNREARLHNLSDVGFHTKGRMRDMNKKHMNSHRAFDAAIMSLAVEADEYEKKGKREAVEFRHSCIDQLNKYQRIIHLIEELKGAL